ncbi:hypothetical protein O9G_003250 [Rozella allomycis CSF55]|uniref:Kinetochore protein Spc24 n=1 Tax=Rozella allomycis (strain CSF55) TaxID=988480 RepID=A0A075AXU2_ROZAC|nr:hypothetical protein O9G_003250 [Rozella allomycis CSF55]|eukprot:EPZ33389.1 hypothetical protein O9G_003250 [Rozella allomycis CSF55]
MTNIVSTADLLEMTIKTGEIPSALHSVQNSYQDLLNLRQTQIEGQRSLIKKKGQLEREIEKLNQQSQTLDERYEVINRQEMYTHIGFEAIVEEGTVKKVRVKNSIKNDVFTLKVADLNKLDEFERANYLWSLLSAKS